MLFSDLKSFVSSKGFLASFLPDHASKSRLIVPGKRPWSHEHGLGERWQTLDHPDAVPAENQAVRGVVRPSARRRCARAWNQLTYSAGPPGISTSNVSGSSGSLMPRRRDRPGSDDPPRHGCCRPAPHGWNGRSSAEILQKGEETTITATTQPAGTIGSPG
ncbi:MAG: hypothetical protein CM15mP77_0280 [Synechococcus sp.]|nr:MAG: hypothetical protein CM15mP77_0280 [Synechococcus sp.]